MQPNNHITIIDFYTMQYTITPCSSNAPPTLYGKTAAPLFTPRVSQTPNPHCPPTLPGSVQPAGGSPRVNVAGTLRTQ